MNSAFWLAFAGLNIAFAMGSMIAGYDEIIFLSLCLVLAIYGYIMFKLEQVNEDSKEYFPQKEVKE